VTEKNKWQLSEPIALRSLFLALSRGPALSNTRCTRSINACATHTQHHRNNLKFDNQTIWCESSDTHHIHIQFLRLADGLLDSLTVVIFVGQEQHHSKGVGEQGDSYYLFIYWHSQLQQRYNWNAPKPLHYCALFMLPLQLLTTTHHHCGKTFHKMTESICIHYS